LKTKDRHETNFTGDENMRREIKIKEGKMEKVFRTIAIGTLVVFCSLVPLGNDARADLMGEIFDVGYFYPDGWTEYGNASFDHPNFVAGPGQETTGNVENSTTINVDITGTTLNIILNTSLSNPVWNWEAFNGLIFTMEPSYQYIASAQVGPGTTLGLFDDSRVSLIHDQVGINWRGLRYTDGDVVQIDFTLAPTPVPEPATLAMLACGLITLLGLRRRGPELTARLS
jgi:hypothetical protein